MSVRTARTLDLTPFRLAELVLLSALFLMAAALCASAALIYLSRRQGQVRLQAPVFRQ